MLAPGLFATAALPMRHAITIHRSVISTYIVPTTAAQIPRVPSNASYMLPVPFVGEDACTEWMACHTNTTRDTEITTGERCAYYVMILRKGYVDKVLVPFDQWLTDVKAHNQYKVRDNLLCEPSAENLGRGRHRWAWFVTVEGRLEMIARRMLSDACLWNSMRPMDLDGSGTAISRLAGL